MSELEDKLEKLIALKTKLENRISNYPDSNLEAYQEYRCYFKAEKDIQGFEQPIKYENYCSYFSLDFLKLQLKKVNNELFFIRRNDQGELYNLYDFQMKKSALKLRFRFKVKNEKGKTAIDPRMAIGTPSASPAWELYENDLNDLGAEYFKTWVEEKKRPKFKYVWDNFCEYWMESNKIGLRRIDIQPFSCQMIDGVSIHDFLNGKSKPANKGPIKDKETMDERFAFNEGTSDAYQANGDVIDLFDSLSGYQKVNKRDKRFKVKSGTKILPGLDFQEVPLLIDLKDKQAQMTKDLINIFQANDITSCIDKDIILKAEIKNYELKENDKHILQMLVNKSYRRSCDNNYLIKLFGYNDKNEPNVNKEDFYNFTQIYLLKVVEKCLKENKLVDDLNDVLTWIKGINGQDFLYSNEKYLFNFCCNLLKEYNLSCVYTDKDSLIIALILYYRITKNKDLAFILHMKESALRSHFDRMGKRISKKVMAEYDRPFLKSELMPKNLIEVINIIINTKKV